ncbi:MAG: cupin domain-containing protein, partial [Acidimicrobiales bacterium]
PESDWPKRAGEYLQARRGKRTYKDLISQSTRKDITEQQLFDIEHGRFGAVTYGEYGDIVEKIYGLPDAHDIPDPGPRPPEPAWVHITKDSPCRASEEDSAAVRWRYFPDRLQGALLRPDFLTLPERRRAGERGQTSISTQGGDRDEQLLYVISGRLNVTFWHPNDTKHTIPMQTGDLLHFRSSIPHRTENTSSAYPAQLLIVRVVHPTPHNHMTPSKPRGRKNKKRT